MFKDNLITYIKNDYSKLKDLEITLQTKKLTGTLYNLLTPYLAHVNTLDSYNRIISFYSQKGSKQQKLLPLYIGLSNYLKAYSEIEDEFSNKTVNTSELEGLIMQLEHVLPKEIIYLNKKWSVIELNFDITRNNRIHLYIESIEKRPVKIAPKIQDILPHLRKSKADFTLLSCLAEKAQVTFNEFLKENEKMLKAKDLINPNQSKIGFKEILGLSKAFNPKPKSGVLLFANKTKYIQLIQETFFNGRRVADIFPISEIKITRDGGLKIEKNVHDKHPVIYLCSQDLYGGWQEIKNEIGSDNLNTIIIDDFDEILDREKKFRFDSLKDFSNSIKLAQNSGEIKDVYLLQKDFNFLNHSILEKFHLDIYPWLFNHQERLYLSNKFENNFPNHLVYSVNDFFGSEYWNRFKPIINKIKQQINLESDVDRKSNYITLLSDGYKLLNRVTSFYSKDILKMDFEEYIHRLLTLEGLRESVSYKNCVSQLSDIQNETYMCNRKLRMIGKIIGDHNFSKIVIFSRNANPTDINYIKRDLKKKFGDLYLVIMDTTETHNLRDKDFDAAFFFNFYGDITNTLFINQFAKFQFLVLNNRAELGYYKKKFNECTPIIRELSSFENKLLLLNLEDQENLVEYKNITFDLKDYIIYEEDIINPSNEENKERVDIDNKEDIEEAEIIEEQDFSSFITKLIEDESENSGNYSNTQDSNSPVLLFFENDFLKIQGHKHLHVLNETDEVEKIQDIRKRAFEIQPGDKVFLMNGFNNDFNELIEHLKDDFDILAKHFKISSSWRKDLLDLHLELGGYVSRLRDYLSEESINVTDPTVERWLSGLTMAPDSLNKIVSLFSRKHNSYTSQYIPEDVIFSTKWMSKFRTSLHKEIFKYHVFKRNNIDYLVEDYTIRNLIMKMDEIVEIKEVILVKTNIDAITTIPQS